MKNVAIIIERNQSNILKESVQRLAEMELFSNIIIADIFSNDMSADVIAQSGFDMVAFDDELKGYATILNVVIDNFDCVDNLFVVNSPCLINKQTVELMLEKLSDKNVGVVGTSNTAKRFEGGNNSYKALGVGTDLFAIKTDKTHVVGKFDENLQIIGNVLMDYTLRTWSAGFEVIAIEDYSVESFSQELNALYNTNFAEADRKNLKEKWGMNYFWVTPNPFIPEMVNREGKNDFTVLEVGCDMGANLIEIKRRNPNCKTYGLEINPRAAKIAGFINEVQEGNIEKLEVPFDLKFDYIVFSDVLEHLHNTETVLAEMKKYLKDDGRIIASIPNIMHISVMKQLMTGRFTYEDSGLLDRTHVHFFTYYEIEKMFREAGYVIDSISTTVMPLEEGDEELIDALVSFTKEGISSDMYKAYQYLIRASLGE